ncbi:MAG TPA: hypothetical protein PLA54_03030 [Spirochaetota bacterium]|nr:hypothetical protein [Spirochaetota bacterium]HQE58149.1 hypothetical protein [Spirochaetota bacterium]
MKNNYLMIKEYLTSKRTVSALNIAEATGVPILVVIELVKRLKDEGFIRIGGSACSSSCSSCSDKCNDSETVISGESIIIPLLERRTSDEY